MSNTAALLVLAIVGGLVGCSDDGGAGETERHATPGQVSPSNYCEAWASACPQDVGDMTVQQCKERCEGGQSFVTDEECRFSYCSVEAGFCDNEQVGDEAIMTCEKAHGWK